MPEPAELDTILDAAGLVPMLTATRPVVTLAAVDLEVDVSCTTLTPTLEAVV